MIKSPKISNIYSARLLINRRQRQNLLIISVLLLYSAYLSSEKLLIVVFLISNLFFLASFLSKFLLFVIGLFLKINAKPEYRFEDEQDLPLYSLLIPLYKEEKVIESLLDALDSLDYPKNKLDIKIIIESDDEETKQKIDNISLAEHYQIIIVPYSIPRTKAKACNFAMQYVKGEYITIYDAEDIPEPLQLKKVIAEFKLAKENVICVQARLNFYNDRENLLTKLFSLEYLIWFDFILPALEYLCIPIPLGGTSNHFITAKLIELGGWDPYNVTEDAELGIRIARAGYITILVDSITLEEAPINLDVWFKQRARWIKGYIQTYIVHMRNPYKLYKSLGFQAFVGVQFFIGVFTITFLMTPFALISWFFFISVEKYYIIMPVFIMLLWKLNLIVSLVNIVKFKLALTINKTKLNIFTIMLHPVYFLLISIASFKSVIQLFSCPYHWDKTVHGVTKYKKNQVFKAKEL